MVWTDDKCVICGKLFPYTKVKSSHKSSRYETNIFTEWKRQCATATCEVLFGNKIDNFVHYFQNTTYCSTCEQIVRDISFTWNQLMSFKNRIHRLSTKICNLLDLNYNNIEEKSETTMIQERFSFLSSKEVPNLESLYSYEEMIEIICSGAQISKLSCQNRNIAGENSVVGRISLRSPDYLSHVEPEVSHTLENQLGIGEIKKEEYSDNENSENEQDCDDLSSIETDWNNELQKEYFDDIKPEITNDNSGEKEKYIESENSSATITKKTRSKIPKGWTRKEHLMRLKRNKHKFSCPEEDCCKFFLSEEDQLAHVKKVHTGERKPYECQKCLMKFTNKPHLVRHIKVVHEDKRERKVARNYTCRICGKIYYQIDQLTAHVSTSHQEPNPYQCAFCPEIYDNTDDLKIHTIALHSDTYNCDNCTKTFHTRDGLRKHKYEKHSPKSLRKQEQYPKKNISKVKHKLTSSINKPKQLVERSHECKFCGKEFMTEEELNEHYTGSHQPPNPFACAFCPQLFTNTTDLKRHTKSQHLTPNALSGKLKCPFCDRYFANRSSLCVHKKSHLHPSLLLTCPLCPALYKQQYLLDIHMESHSEEKKYMCELCGKSYKRAESLRHHSKLHDESQRKWKCMVCDKKFFSSQQRKNHEVCHSNVKEFVCQVCGKAFNRSYNLTAHLKTHSNKTNPSIKTFINNVSDIPSA